MKVKLIDVQNMMKMFQESTSLITTVCKEKKERKIIEERKVVFSMPFYFEV